MTRPIDRTSGVNSTPYVTNIQRLEAAGIKFDFNSNKISELPKTKALDSSTNTTLAKLDGYISPRMADDLLAEPYISLNFNA